MKIWDTPQTKEFEKRMLQAEWELYVDRPTWSIPPSPGGWITNNVLVWDPNRATLVYVREPDHHEWGESWHLSNGKWVKDHEAAIAMGARGG